MSDIDRRRFLGALAAGSLPPSLLAAVAAAADATPGSAALVRAFADPPAEASPGVYWYWLGGNVSREGISADLTAMREAGIRSAVLFAVGRGGPDSPVQPPVNALTPAWWELLEHAVQEAARLGMVLSLNCCDGWGTAGGRWITPQLSMQRVIWTDRTVIGGQPIECMLERGAVQRDYYRDIVTIAVPHPASWDESSFTRPARIRTNLPLKVPDPALISVPDSALEVIDTQEPGWIEYQFDEPFTLRSVRVQTPSPPGYSPGVYRAANSLEVHASDDGTSFRRIGELEYPRHGWQTDLTTLTHALPETRARYFRLVHQRLVPGPYEEEHDFGQDTRLRFFNIVLSSEPRIHHLAGKSGQQWAISRRTTAEDVPNEACVRPADIIDLSARLDATGRLAWDAPPGRWRIVRIGCTTTGAETSAAGAAGGLECDRFNPEAAQALFAGWFEQALVNVGPSLAGRALKVMHVDSWEAGSQNWSPVFAARFRELRGYDLIPYMAVLTGIPVESADVSERVLLDVRRTINELMQTAFFGTLAGLAHAHGCLLSAEPANPTFPSDSLAQAAHVDLPMGEFWLNTPRNDKPTDIQDAVSGARLHGRRIAAAEAFTQGLMDWDEHPFKLKALGDRIFCEGINRLVLHVYAQQPWVDRAPGMTLNGIGTFFSRTQTWWRPGRAWLDYLRRCQALLQEGRAVSDVCFFTGENIPARALLPRQLSTPLPDGYRHDCINRDALLQEAQVRDGWIVLRHGARYRVLVLPDEELLTPEIAARLAELVHAGAVLVGPRPQRSPSFSGGAEADSKVQQVARELWGNGGAEGHEAATDRAVGRGRVVWGRPLALLLGELGLPPDLALDPPDAPVNWIHRNGPGWDLYFLSNPSDTAAQFTALCRTSGRRPQLCHPDSGAVESLALWREEDGRTHVPLCLDAAGSVFLLFAGPATVAPVTQLSGAGSDAVRLIERDRRVEATVCGPGTWTLQTSRGGPRQLTVSELPEPIALDGPWRLTFTEHLAHPIELTLPALSSWTELVDDSVKHYSGTARYRLAWHLPAALLQAGRQRLLLDLGEVCDLVDIRVNATSLGVLWKPPFVVDITQVVRAGRNELELAVTNTWRNRLIGDFDKPPGERRAFVVPLLRKGQPWLPGSTGTVLSPAGLLGPARVRFAAVVDMG